MQKEKQTRVSGTLVLCTDLRWPNPNTSSRCFVHLGHIKACHPQVLDSPLKSQCFINWCFTVQLAELAMDMDQKLWAKLQLETQAVMHFTICISPDDSSA